MTSTIFETPRFRVHIAGKSAWLENKEPIGWVLRAQLTIPVSTSSLTDVDQNSLIRAAVLEFENARLGDTSLRDALMGTQYLKRPMILPSALTRPAPSRIFTKTQLRKPNPGQHGWRQPVRPPLRPMLSQAPATPDEPKLPPPDPDPERDPPVIPYPPPLPDPESPDPDVVDPGMPEPLRT